MKSQLIRTLLATWALTCGYFVFTDSRPAGILLGRQNNCYVEVSAFGHYYGGGYAGSRFGSQWFNASGNVDCAANWGQSFADSVGGAACTQYGLRGGVGYVLLSWDWFYTAQPTDSGHLNQQFDCDAL